MNLEKTKSLFLKTLIGCLIASAGLAVFAVLLGEFNDILGKALLTIVIIAVHSLISFAFLVNNEKQETFESLEFFTNATFMILILSFITLTLGVWLIIPGELVGKLFLLYLVLLFATLHGEVLAKTTGKQTNIDRLVNANFALMFIVVLMLVPVIFVADTNDFGPFYYRLLAAFGIVDATLTLIVVILHKLYLQKHPKTPDPVFNMQIVGAQPGSQPGAQNTQVTVTPQKKKGMNIFVILLLVYIVLQFVGGLVVAVIGHIYS